MSQIIGVLKGGMADVFDFSRKRGKGHGGFGSDSTEDAESLL